MPYPAEWFAKTCNVDMHEQSTPKYRREPSFVLTPTLHKKFGDFSSGE